MSKRVKTCKYCGSAIDFVPKPNGGWHCVEFDPILIIEEERGDWYIDENGEKVYGREYNPRLDEDRETEKLAVFVPHFRNCTGRDKKELEPVKDVKKQVKGTTVTCKRCGAQIGFIRNPKTGKYMPVESKPYFYNRDNKGDQNLVISTGELVRVKITEDFEHCEGVGFLPHWFNCLNNER